MIIDQLIIAKTKTNTVFLFVNILIDTSQYFVYALFSLANKSQLALSM